MYMENIAKTKARQRKRASEREYFIEDIKLQ